MDPQLAQRHAQCVQQQFAFNWSDMRCYVQLPGMGAYWHDNSQLLK
jgi:hypothetical protein